MARPFAWGEQDCCTFGADWLLEVTGFDPLYDLRGITSPLQAMRTLRAFGGYEAAARQRLGEPLPSPLFAQVGDIVLLPSGRRPGRASGYAFGICNGSTVAAPGQSGLVFPPITSGIAAWRV